MKITYGQPSAHTFTQSEIRQAEQDFADMIKKIWGEVWKIKWNGEYVGVSWDCESPLLVLPGVFKLCETARHKGALRAAGKIETRKGNSVLRFILFYDPVRINGGLIT